MQLVQAGPYVAKIQKYRDGKMCVTVDKNNEPWASLSVNTDCWPEIDEFVLNHDCNGKFAEKMLSALLDTGHFVDTGKTAHYGYCCQPVWKYVP